MNKIDLIIGVDLDGVCANFYGRMREITAEWLEVDINSLTEEVTYGLPEWGISGQDSYIKLHRFAVTQRALFESEKMIPGTRRYLRQLSDEGARIRIITHRFFIPYFHKIAAIQTIDWLEKYGIPYWDLCFMKDKEQVGANIYIDDSPSNVVTLRNKGLYAICFENSTNHEIEQPKAKKREEVYKLVHEYADNK